MNLTTVILLTILLWVSGFLTCWILFVQWAGVTIFLGEYWHKGSWWGFNVPSENFDDATERLKQVGRTGKILGPLAVTIPCVPGCEWLIRGICTGLNWWKGIGKKESR